MTEGEVTFLTEVSRDVRAGRSVSDYKVKVAVQILIDHAIGQRQNPIYEHRRSPGFITPREISPSTPKAESEGTQKGPSTWTIPQTPSDPDYRDSEELFRD